MKRWVQIVLHVVAWIVLLGGFIGLAISNAKLSTEFVLVIFLVFPCVNLTLFYLNYLVLMPHFLDKKRYSTYAITLVGAIIFYGFIKYGVALAFKPVMFMHNKGHEAIFWPFFFNTLFTSLIFLFLSAVLKFTIDWFLNERIQRDLENQRLTAELAFLKSQINPHFLFNSLNSIYSLAYQRSETTPDAILKLSEIMRYMLYGSNDNKVDLAKEFHYLQNYIDLQKIRFGNKAYIDFKIEGDPDHQQIAPLLLIAFIENAFKHGVANNPQTPIKMRVEVHDAHLQFYMQNKKHNNNRDPEGGVGLSNVKRRLDLLYPQKYNLNIIDEPDSYTVELSLVL